MGFWEAVIVIFIILLLFGGKRIPRLFKNIGEGIGGFKEEKNKNKKEDK